MTLRKLAGAGVTETDNLRLLTLLERFHDLSTFRSIMGAQGLPIFKLGEESGWRPLRKNQRKVERLRERFADLIHELFAVLIAASSKEAGEGIQLARLETALEAVARSADALAPKDDELRMLVEAALAEEAETAVARTPRGPQKAQRPRRRGKAAD